ARACPLRRRRRLRRAGDDPRAGSDRASGRAARTADRGDREPHLPDRERRAAPHAHTRRRGRHRQDGRRLPVMTVFAVIDWQTLADAVGQGAIYALMAVGIGLVFGVLRLINFAYGQLVMAGAFALALASGWNWPVWAGIIFCFAVVMGLSLVMEQVVFR